MTEPKPPRQTPPRPYLSTLPNAVFKALALALSLFALWSVFRDIDLDKTLALVSRLGFLLPLILLPYLFFIALDVAGWQHCYPALGARASYWDLLRLRLACEGVLLSLPAGIAAAESLKVLVLHTRYGMPVAEGVASFTVAKCVAGVAHAVYVGICAAVCFSILQAASPQVLGIPGLEWMTILLAVLMLAGFGFAAAAVFYGSLAERLYGALMRIPVKAVQRAIEKRRDKFLETDRSFSRAGKLTASEFSVSFLYYLASWSMETLDTFLIFYLLGVPLTVPQAMSVETLLSLLRSALFILPAGLGVQDIGYALFLEGFGVPDAVTVGAAFVVLKRAKELFWILVAYLIVGSYRVPVFKTDAQPAPLSEP